MPGIHIQRYIQQLRSEPFHVVADVETHKYLALCSTHMIKDITTRLKEVETTECEENGIYLLHGNAAYRQHVDRCDIVREDIQNKITTGVVVDHLLQLADENHYYYSNIVINIKFMQLRPLKNKI